jgi:CheY-like chemotaxis protein
LKGWFRRTEKSPDRSDGNDRITTTGPAILLLPATAQTIALVLHELVTNAAKYGALSADDGHVELTWSKAPEALELTWIESGGPKVDAPKRRGYGTRVIAGGIENQLGGSADFDWHPDGLRFKLSVPYDDKSPPIGEPPTETFSVGTVGDHGGFSDGSGRRILLVEDEPMISMMLADMLNEGGHQVDGPHATVRDAMLAATKNELQGGILDVNVRGEKVYVIADLLTSRSVPFVFVTGCAADSIDSRFRDVPVLQKPIEPQRLWAALAKSSEQMTDTATSQIRGGLRRDRNANEPK